MFRQATHRWYHTSWAAVAAVAAAAQQQQKEDTHCCGLVGVIGNEQYSSRTFLLNGLSILKNRGFDSAGIATMQGQQMVRVYL